MILRLYTYDVGHVTNKQNSNLVSSRLSAEGKFLNAGILGYDRRDPKRSSITSFLQNRH